MSRNRKVQSSNFVDYVKIYCKSGKGGAGSAHLRREKFVAKGGPDGGDGGRGGHVILRANSQLWTLINLKYRKHVTAGNGGNGSKQTSTGADGKDAIIDVPAGTVARDGDTGEILFELTDHGDQKTLVPGGRGGLGNNHFKSPTNQTPRTAQPGEPNREGWYILELKVLADIGLVGFPNAGKSTLLSTITAAKPEIASYAFTTMEPNLGIVPYRDHKSFIVADIPGIIEGAHEGRGIGYQFLRHIERNSGLLFMIPADSEDHLKEFEVLQNELQKYNPELMDKDFLVVVSKSDMLDDELEAEIRDCFPEGLPHLFISSVAQKNMQPLKDQLWQLLEKPVDEGF